MKTKDYLLIVGAVATVIQVASTKFKNTTVNTMLGLLGIGLAWFANHPERMGGTIDEPEKSDGKGHKDDQPNLGEASQS